MGKGQESRVGHWLRGCCRLDIPIARIPSHSFIHSSRKGSGRKKEEGRRKKEEGRRKKEKERTIDQHIGERIDAVHHHQPYQSSCSSVVTLS